MKKVTYLVLAISLIASSAKAQKKADTQAELDSGTVEQQFDYIINKSTSFKDFQLIRRTSIHKVKLHTLDSLKTVRSELKEANSKVVQYNNDANSLKTEVKSLNTQIETLTNDVNSISFIGMPLSKTAYNGIVWFIIASLIAGLLIFMFLFKKSNSTTKLAVNDLEKVNDDFEAFRKKALVKEQEIMRKLQNEINKHSS
ncbi:MAG: hypothetical protein ACPGSL_04460 [Vicingaceae bacterium]